MEANQNEKNLLSIKYFVLAVKVLILWIKLTFKKKKKSSPSLMEANVEKKKKKKSSPSLMEANVEKKKKKKKKAPHR